MAVCARRRFAVPLCTSHWLDCFGPRVRRQTRAPSLALPSPRPSESPALWPPPSPSAATSPPVSRPMGQNWSWNASGRSVSWRSGGNRLSQAWVGTTSASSMGPARAGRLHEGGFVLPGVTIDACRSLRRSWPPNPQESVPRPQLRRAREGAPDCSRRGWKGGPNDLGMRLDQGGVAAGHGQSERHVDSPAARGRRIDERSALRMKLADDLLKASDPGLDLDQDRVRRSVEAEVDRTPARSGHGRLDRRPPPRGARAEQLLDDRRLDRNRGSARRTPRRQPGAGPRRARPRRESASAAQRRGRPVRAGRPANAWSRPPRRPPPATRRPAAASGGARPRPVATRGAGPAPRRGWQSGSRCDPGFASFAYKSRACLLQPHPTLHGVSSWIELRAQRKHPARGSPQFGSRPRRRSIRGCRAGPPIPAVRRPLCGRGPIRECRALARGPCPRSPRRLSQVVGQNGPFSVGTQ